MSASPPRKAGGFRPWLWIVVAAVAALGAAWLVHRQAQQRLDAAGGADAVDAGGSLEGLRAGAERRLEPIQPGVVDWPFLDDVRAVLAVGEDVWVGTTGGLRVLPAGGAEERVYTARSGLLRSDVVDLAVHRDTVVVAHPEGGLSLVRGERVRTVSHPDLVPTAVADAPDGVLVATAGQGLLRWDGEALVEVPIRGEGPDGAWDLQRPRLTDVAHDPVDGSTWVATFDRGAARRDAGGWELQGMQHGLADAFVTSLACAHRGDDAVVLIGTQTGLTLREGGRDRIFGAGQGLPDDHVSAVALLDDRLAVGTFGGGLALYEDADWHAVAPPDLPSGYVQTVAYDARGRLWVGTRGGLALRHEGRWEPRPGPDGPPGARITALAVAEGGPEAGLWVGTFERGVGARLAGSWSSYGTGDGLPSAEVNALTFHRGVLWVATNAGPAFFSDGQFVRHPRLGALRGKAATALLSDGDALWIGTASGVTRLGPDGAVRRTGVRDGLINGHVYALAAAADRVWAGTLGGLSAVPREGGPVPGELAPVLAGPGGLSHAWVNALLTRGDEVWVGTYGGGVDRHDGEAWSRVYPTGDETLEINPGAAAWIGDRPAFGTLDRGLLVVGEQRAELLDEELGLGCPSVTALRFDGSDVWIGTAAGLSRVPASSVVR